MNQCADSWKNNLFPAIPKPLICQRGWFWVTPHRAAPFKVEWCVGESSSDSLSSRVQANGSCEEDPSNHQIRARFRFDWDREPSGSGV